jgi:primase-polymerase (primpol)-like protein
MTSPNTTPVDSGALPAGIVERDQWVCWREEERDGKPTKVPVRPETGDFASTTDPDTWTSFERAVEAVEDEDVDGVGFVFSAEDPIVGVDLDECRVPETGNPGSTAQTIIERLDSYTEVSPSGTGYHVLVEGDLPDGRNRRGSIELYDSARFFTVTGEHVSGTPDRIESRQEALTEVYREYVGDGAVNSDRTDASATSTGGTDTDGDVTLDDVDVVERARRAENGEKFEQLWTGTIAGYDSHSEADMALCCLLAFWTGGDRSQIDRLFRQSGLMREKWDDIHYADGSTYGEKTIKRAVSTATDSYDPAAGSKVRQAEIPDTEQTVRTNSDGHQQSPAHLAERNRLLRGRVAELKAVIEEKNARIETLEARLRKLQE